jgi:uncharacterized SAM-binding protein YcdF (DUF218 family)
VNVVTGPRHPDDTPVAAIRPIPPSELDALDGTDDGAGPHPKRRRPGPRRVVLRAVLLVVLLSVGYYAVTLYQVWSTGRSDQARPVDAIVVMGAAQYDGRPSPQLAARLDHAADLYAAGIAPVVVVTGGRLPDDRYTEAEASARYLGQRGVPDAVLVLENEGRTSFESLHGVAAIARQRGIERVLIVTDPFHALRSRLIAQDAGLVAYVSPTPTSVVTGATELRHELVEAAGISFGRLVGFGRL